jgi:uncharacterized protein YciI
MSDEPALEPHVICLLRSAPNRPDLSEAELDAIQERHVAYQQQLRADGKIAAAGPFSDQPDESWRGLTMYVTSLEEARALAAADPAVVAGRLVVDVFQWWTPKDASPL